MPGVVLGSCDCSMNLMAHPIPGGTPELQLKASKSDLHGHSSLPSDWRLVPTQFSVAQTLWSVPEATPFLPSAVWSLQYELDYSRQL